MPTPLRKEDFLKKETTFPSLRAIETTSCDHISFKERDPERENHVFPFRKSRRVVLQREKQIFAGMSELVYDVALKVTGLSAHEGSSPSLGIEAV